MHSLLTLIKAVCLTITLGAPTAAFANVSTPSTIPPVEAPVEASVCPNGPTWEQEKASLILQAESEGVKFIGDTVLEDGRIAAFFDVRGMASYDGSKDFILLLGFTPDGCFVISFLIDETTMKDQYGIVLANAG